MEIAARGRGGMALRAFLCQNVAVGSAFGGFGVTVLPLQNAFGIGRGMATLGLALAVLVMGAAAPVVAAIMGRLGLRRTMLTGIVLSGTGYGLLGLAPMLGGDGIYLVLLAYGLPIGMGLVMFGAFGASMLVSGWFPSNPGPVLGFVNMPVLVMALPMIGVPVIGEWGLGTFYFLLAGLHLLLLPFALGIADPPILAGGVSASGMDGISASAIVTRPVFWALVTGAGILSAIGIIGVTHLVAFGVERGIAEPQAALFVSVMGGASIAGSLVVGLLCGWFGPARTLALVGVLAAAGWGLLWVTTFLPLMIAVVLLIGAGGAGVFPSVNVMARQVFGTEALHRVMGFYGLATLPFTFVLPPLAGVLHDLAGSYGPVVAGMIAGALGAAMLFAGMARLRRGQSAAPLGLQGQGSGS